MAIRYKVRPGDTLQSLGNPQTILQANPGIANLSTGQVIKLPSLDPIVQRPPRLYSDPNHTPNEPAGTIQPVVAPVVSPVVAPVITPTSTMDDIFRSWMGSGGSPKNVSYNWRL